MRHDPDHHDRRYEDGDSSTGTIADYGDWLTDRDPGDESDFADAEHDDLPGLSRPRIAGMQLYRVSRIDRIGRLSEPRTIFASSEDAAIQGYRALTGNTFSALLAETI